METTIKTKTDKKQRVSNIVKLVTIGMLSAVAIVLMLFAIPLWFVPMFYKIDISEVPVLIGGFALGPIAGVFVELIKILLNLMIDGTDTAFVGEFANFLMGCSMVIPSAIIYKRKKTKSSAVIGLIVGSISLVIVSSLLNAYVLLPAYATAFRMPIEGLIGAGAAINPRITGMKTFILLAVVPFNLIKGILSSVITFVLYKKINHIIKNFN